MSKGYSSKSNATRAAKKEYGHLEFHVWLADDKKWYFAEETACAAETAVLTQGVEEKEDSRKHNGDDNMNDTVTEDTGAAKAEAEAALQQALAVQGEAQDNLTETNDSIKEFKKAVTACKKGVKDATAALKAVPEGDDHDAKREAAQNVLDQNQNALTQNETNLAGLVEKKAALTASLKTAKAAVKDAKKAVTAANKVKKPKVEREERNGMKRPTPGTISDTLWTLFDNATETKGSTAAIGDVMEAALEAGIKEASVKAGYSHWRKFNGITGRVLSDKQIADKAAKEAAKAAKAAEKAAKAAEAAETEAG